MPRLTPGKWSELMISFGGKLNRLERALRHVNARIEEVRRFDPDEVKELKEYRRRLERGIARTQRAVAYLTR